MDDEREKQEMMEVMGLGKHFDKVNSPFYNKIIIGASVEVLHDVKSIIL